MELEGVPTAPKFPRGWQWGAGNVEMSESHKSPLHWHSCHVGRQAGSRCWVIFTGLRTHQVTPGGNRTKALTRGFGLRKVHTRGWGRG